jgi:sulfide:quinone oxidoreductase
VAGLEAMLALRDLAGERVEITLLTPEHDFVFRPPAVGAPFGRGRAERRPLAEVARQCGARLHIGSLAAVDDAARQAVDDAGGSHAYEALLVAVGAGSAPAYRSAITWTPDRDPEVFGGILRDLDDGYAKQVAFVVPPGAAWPLPAYELALMTAWQAWGMSHDDVEITVYTPEEAPLAAFGEAAAAAIRAELHQAGVHVDAGAFVHEGPSGLVAQPGDRPLGPRRAIALPVAASRPPAGIATDARGFIPCDLHGRVAGTSSVWAAGDAIAFPIKQGGLATQQADAAAEAIAAAAGVDIEPAPFRPVLRGVVLTGRGRQWMRRDLHRGAGTVSADLDDLDRKALWWPPTKVAGRYLSPFLAGGAEGAPPPGEPVELDLGREVAAAIDALRMARLRDAQHSSGYALRRAARLGEAEQARLRAQLEAFGAEVKATEDRLRAGGHIRRRDGSGW